MTTAGLWLAHRRLVTVLVGPDGVAHRTLRAALTDDARFGLLEYLIQSQVELVATDGLTRSDPLPAQAAQRGLAVWRVDDSFVGALFRAAAIRDPARAAALLARLPQISLLRASLRRLIPPGAQAHQLHLL